MEDTDIIDLFIVRDESAILFTAEKYGRNIRGIAYNVLRNVETVEECENDTYLTAWNSIPPKEPRTYFFPFLSKIIRHIAIDRYRKENSKKRGGEFYDLSIEAEQCIPDCFDMESVMECRQIVVLINQYLGSIPKNKRNVFVRRYYYLDSIDSISKRYCYSVSKVKSMLQRCRKELCALLEHEEVWICKD